MSKRQDFIDAFKVRMESIRIANGYYSDLGKNVFEWRDTERQPIEESELPCINIRDAEADIYVEVISQWTHDLSIDIELYCAKGEDTPAEIRLLIEDMLTAIGTDEKFGISSVAYMEFDSEGNAKHMKLAIEQHEKMIAKASFRLRLVYRTAYWEL